MDVARAICGLLLDFLLPPLLKAHLDSPDRLHLPAAHAQNHILLTMVHRLSMLEIHLIRNIDMIIKIL